MARVATAEVAVAREAIAEPSRGDLLALLAATAWDATFSAGVWPRAMITGGINMRPARTVLFITGAIVG